MPRIDDLTLPGLPTHYAESLDRIPLSALAFLVLFAVFVFVLARPLGEWVVLAQVLCQTRLTHVRRTVWWYFSIGWKLSRMLELSALPLAARRRSLRFFVERLIPLFGPCPPEFYSLKNTGSYKPIVRTPMELVWVLDGKRPMSVRFSMEILNDETGKPSNPEEFREAVQDIFAGAAANGQMKGFDSTWPDICYNVMLDHTWVDRKPDCNPIQFFPGGEFGPDGITAKYYFYPSRAAATGEVPFNVVNDCIAQVGLAEQWQPVMDFLNANPKYGASPDFVGVEAVSPASNRFKVYVRIHSDFSSLVEIRRITTLGGAIATPAVLETLAQFERFWRLLYPNHRDDQVVQSLRPGAKGMLIYFEMGIGRRELIPKIYIPAYRFEGNDEHVARAITTYHRKYDQGGEIEKNYEAHFKSMFPGYDLKQKLPLIHTYIGMATKKGTTQMTVYLAMDPFRVAHT